MGAYQADIESARHRCVYSEFSIPLDVSQELVCMGSSLDTDTPRSHSDAVELMTRPVIW